VLGREEAARGGRGCVGCRRRGLGCFRRRSPGALLVTLHVDFIGGGRKDFLHLLLPSGFGLRVSLPDTLLDAVQLLHLGFLTLEIGVGFHFVELSLPLLRLFNLAFVFKPRLLNLLVRCLYSELKSLASLRQSLAVLAESVLRHLQLESHLFLFRFLVLLILFLDHLPVLLALVAFGSQAEQISLCGLLLRRNFAFPVKSVLRECLNTFALGAACSLQM
jgi:hypothetical protein